MLTSATGKENNRRRLGTRPVAGFTLLEVLVVLVIIGVIIGFATLAIDTAPRELRREADRLASLLELGGEEAVMNGREYRLLLHRHGYAFEQLTNGKWQKSTAEMLRPRQLPEELNLELLLDGQPQVLSGSEASEQGEPVALYLLSSGEISPFELTISEAGATTMTISSDGESITSQSSP